MWRAFCPVVHSRLSFGGKATRGKSTIAVQLHRYLQRDNAIDCKRCRGSQPASHLTDLRYIHSFIHPSIHSLTLWPELNRRSRGWAFVAVGIRQAVLAVEDCGWMDGWWWYLSGRIVVDYYIIQHLFTHCVSVSLVLGYCLLWSHNSDQRHQRQQQQQKEQRKSFKDKERAFLFHSCI